MLPLDEMQKAQTEVANAQAKARHINETIMRQMYSDGLVKQSETIKNRANDTRSTTLYNVSKAKDHLDKSMGMMHGSTVGFFGKIGNFFKGLKDRFLGLFGKKGGKAMQDAEQEALSQAEKSKDLNKTRLASIMDESQLRREIVATQNEGLPGVKLTKTAGEAKLDTGIAASRAIEEAQAVVASDEQKTGLRGVASMAAKRPRKIMTPEEAVRESERIQTLQSQQSTADISRVLRGGVGNEDLAGMRAAYTAPRTGYKTKAYATPEPLKDDFQDWTGNLPANVRARLNPDNVWTSDLSPEQKAMIARRRGKGAQAPTENLTWGNVGPGQASRTVQGGKYVMDMQHGVFSRSGNTRASAADFNQPVPNAIEEQQKRMQAGMLPRNITAANHEQFGVKYGPYDPGILGNRTRYGGTAGVGPVDRLDKWTKDLSPAERDLVNPNLTWDANLTPVQRARLAKQNNTGFGGMPAAGQPITPDRRVVPGPLAEPVNRNEWSKKAPIPAPIPMPQMPTIPMAPVPTLGADRSTPAGWQLSRNASNLTGIGPGPIATIPNISGGAIPNLEGRAGTMATTAATNAVAASIMSVPLARQTTETGAMEPQVRSAPIADAYDRIRQEQAGAEAGSPKLQSSELSAIQEASMKQVDHLAHINETLEAIKGLLTPKEGTSLSGRSPAPIKGSTTPNTTSLGSTDFGKWQFGRNAGNASNQVINDGTS
jgi:hypothetical protein